jgi:hypothetical protein
MDSHVIAWKRARARAQVLYSCAYCGSTYSDACIDAAQFWGLPYSAVFHGE